MIKKEIGRRIKALRKNKLHLTQAEFAKRLNWDRTFISRIESGKQNITIESLAQICRELNVSFQEFFEDFSNKNYLLTKDGTK